MIVLTGLALAVSAGGASGQGPVTGARLALMPLPLGSLDPAARALPLSPDSGVQSNSDAASNTNARTTAQTFVRLGRLSGYSLDYSDPGAGAISKGHGLIEVNSEVDLYRDAKSVAGGLEFMQKDDLNVAGLRSPLLSLRASTFAPAGMHGPAFGLNGVSLPTGVGSLYSSQIMFEAGSLLAEVSVTGADAEGLQAMAQTLAAKLRGRIAAVLTGKITGPAIALPPVSKAGPPSHGPDLAKLAIEPGDLGSGTVTHQAYQLDNDLHPVSEYLRRMEPAGAFGFIESEVTLFLTAAQAKVTSALLIDTLASKAALAQTLGSDFGGVHITSIDAKPVKLGGADQPSALLITMHLQNGSSFVVAFAAVHVGKTMEFMTVFGPQGKPVEVSALANLAKVAASRLGGRRSHSIVA